MFLFFLICWSSLNLKSIFEPIFISIFQWIFQYKTNKRGCVFSMVIWPAFRMGQHRVNDPPYRAPQFIEKTYIGCCSFSFNARACEACAACWACCAAAAADRSIGRADAAVWLLITSTPGSDLTLSPAPPRPRVDNEAPPSGLLNSWMEQCYVYERMYPWISFLKLKRYNLSV